MSNFYLKNRDPFTINQTKKVTNNSLKPIRVASTRHRKYILSLETYFICIYTHKG